MNQYLSIALFFILILTGTHSHAQKGIKGSYYTPVDFTGSSLFLSKNFTYVYKTHSCTSRSIDSGRYERHGDTLVFHSDFTPADEINKHVWLRATHEKTPTKYIDTLSVFVDCNTDSGFIYSMDIDVNKGVHVHMDSLTKGVSHIYKIPVNRLSDSMQVYASVLGEETDVSGTGTVRFTVSTNRRKQVRILTNKMLYCGKRIYFINKTGAVKNAVYLKRK